MQALKKFFCFLSPRARVPRIKKQKKHEKNRKRRHGHILRRLPFDILCITLHPAGMERSYLRSVILFKNTSLWNS